MFELSSLVPILVAFFVAAASPGPATIAVSLVSMNAGRNAGMIYGYGLSVGLAFWGIVAATGLGAILEASNIALTILKVVGGIYLIWLAFGSIRSAFRVNQIRSASTPTKYGFSHGLMLNLSNPKAVFAWMAVLSLGLGNSSQFTHVFTATFSCIILGFLIYAAYALLFSTNRAIVVYNKVGVWVDITVGSIFAIAGLALIKDAFSKQG